MQPSGSSTRRLANTVYGIFASPFLPTSNVVAANVITGTARALAYAMMQSLNGLLVITDGVLYRRDRIPAGRFANCLEQHSDYPLLAATDGKFLNPKTIPNDDKEFTEWYIKHVMQFFGVTGRTEYESLFRLHALNHKELPKGGVAFDGLIADGGSNYLKLMQSGSKKWQVAEMKARSFSEHQKETLGTWLCDVCERDELVELPEPILSSRLLGVHDALRQTAAALQESGGQAIVPLGLDLPTMKNYKIIKPSAFVFRTAKQRKGILKEWGRLNEKTGCGPELLALRRTYKGSLSAVARKMYELIRSGKKSLETLNMDREWRPDSKAVKNLKKIQTKRKQLQSEFKQSLVIKPGEEPLTGLVIKKQEVDSMLSK